MAGLSCPSGAHAGFEEALLTLLLGNLEHFINHQYQLFAYLKMLGVPLGTRDLYVWRGR